MELLDKVDAFIFDCDGENTGTRFCSMTPDKILSCQDPAVHEPSLMKGDERAYWECRCDLEG